MHYRTKRKGEFKVYGVIESFRPHTPRGRLATVVVVGHTHAGVYYLNRRLLPKGMPSLDQAAFCMFTNREGTPLRLYIAGRKIFPIKRRRVPFFVAIEVKRQYVPFKRQGTFKFVTPWE